MWFSLHSFLFHRDTIVLTVMRSWFPYLEVIEQVWWFQQSMFSLLLWKPRLKYPFTARVRNSPALPGNRCTLNRILPHLFFPYVSTNDLLSAKAWVCTKDWGEGAGKNPDSYRLSWYVVGRAWGQPERADLLGCKIVGSLSSPLDLLTSYTYGCVHSNVDTDIIKSLRCSWRNKTFFSHSNTPPPSTADTIIGVEMSYLTGEEWNHPANSEFQNNTERL